MSNAESSLLVVGSVAFDSVETATDKRVEVLGGAASFVSVAAGFLSPSPVRLIGVVGDDFPAAHTAFLEQQRVDLAGLERVAGRTFRWSGVYSPDFTTRTTLDTQLNVFQDFRPKLPTSWKSSDYVFLANIDPVLQLSVLEQAARPKFVACDTMNFWISGKRPGAGAAARARRHAAAQRRGGAPALRPVEPAGGGARDPRDGAARGGDQAR